jgi:crossover junction endodeoxyribonuclease RusA
MNIFMLPYPPSVNTLWRHSGNRTYKTKRYTDWIEDAGRHLAQQEKPETIAHPVKVEMAIGRPDKRRRDIDNLTKGVLDILVHHKILEDDHWVHHLDVYWSGQVVGCQVIIKDLVGQVQGGI